MNSNTAHEIAVRVRARETSAEALIQGVLHRIRKMDPVLNCFTTVLDEKAMEDARAIDRKLADGERLGPLAGVPFGVKDLFDVAGVVTRAGSKILAENAPARTDAILVQRLKRAGAVLVGCQNMDEFAYGFTTENAHYGATRNPHDTERVAGGSSGGSAASVAAGLLPLSLGSDTNGSIRVPASFCGIFGLKPTFGRLPRTGTFPFVHDLDHLGPFAGNVQDLALAYDLMQGHDAGDRACAARMADPASSSLGQGIAGIRAGVLLEWFEAGATDDALAAVETVARALGRARPVVLPEARRARAAAYCITCASGAELHRQRLHTRPQDFDPVTRDRFYAGLRLPATVAIKAQRFRRWFAAAATELFRHVDVLLAPATPGIAPLVGQKTIMLGDTEVSTRQNIGVYTQPISFIGLPVVAVPLWTASGMPIGVQVIAPPWQEGLALRVAAHLESTGVCTVRKTGA